MGDVLGNFCPADHGRQRAPLDEDGHENDEDDDEDEQAAVREWRAAERGRRYGQRRGERHGAAESRPGGDQPLAPADATLALRLAAVDDAEQDGGDFPPEDPGRDHDSGDGESDVNGVAKSAVHVGYTVSAPGIWTPTNTHNEPLSRNVAMSQNAKAARRERARITTGPE